MPFVFPDLLGLEDGNANVYHIYSAVCEDTVCISKPQPAPDRKSSVASGPGPCFGQHFVGAQMKG